MKQKQTSTIIFKISIGLVILLILLRLFEIQLLNSVFIFFNDTTFFFGFIFLIGSFIYMISTFPRYSNAWKSIGIIGISILALWYIPFSSLTIWMDFNLKKSERIAFVKQVQTKLEFENFEVKYLELNSENKYLSNGTKKVIIEKFKDGDCIFFYTYRGLTDHFSGFVFVPSESIFKDIKVNDINRSIIFEYPKEIKKMEDNWYFVAN